MKEEKNSQRDLYFKRKIGNGYGLVKISKPEVLKYSLEKNEVLKNLNVSIHDLPDYDKFEEDYKVLKKLIYSFIKEHDYRNHKLTIGYDAYINSEQWAEKRRQTIVHHGVKCKDCGKNAMDIHHLHYRTLYFEDPKTDLIPLCRECHSLRHSQ